MNSGPGETEDNFVADFAIGICAGQIKAGAPSRSGNLPKYNQILRIEEELGIFGKYAGEKFHDPLIDLLKPKDCPPTKVILLIVIIIIMF